MGLGGGREFRAFRTTLSVGIKRKRCSSPSKLTRDPIRPVCLLSSQEVDGRPLRVTISVARGERPERAPRERGESSYSFDARKIYFGNLSWGMDHLDLQDLCGEFGTVEDSRLITDRETGRLRGFGFVTMSTTEEAEEVVRQLNGPDVAGRVLRVNIANVDK